MTQSLMATSESGSPARILVVDDNSSVARLIAHILSTGGYEVALAANGREAWVKLLEGDYVAVLTDIVMPDMDGLELIKKIRTWNDNIAIVAMSGGGTVATMDFLPTAQAFGANAVFSKPFRAQPLLQIVANVLSARGSAPEVEPAS